MKYEINGNVKFVTVKCAPGAAARFLIHQNNTVNIVNGEKNDSICEDEVLIPFVKYDNENEIGQKILELLNMIQDYNDYTFIITIGQTGTGSGLFKGHEAY